MSAATMTHYHPDQFLLNDYVAGSLPGAAGSPPVTIGRARLAGT